MNASAFSDVWDLLFDYFGLIVDSLGEVVIFMNTPILNFLGPSEDYSVIVNKMLVWISNQLNSFNNVTVLGFVLGVGITTYLIFSVIKFFVPVL